VLRRLTSLALLVACLAAAGRGIVGVEVEGGELPELAALVGEELDRGMVGTLLEEEARRLAAAGFLDAQIEVEYVERAGGILLRVNIDTGERAPLGEVTINGARTLEPVDIEAAARAGWRREGVSGLLDAVARLYAAAGYLELESRLGGFRRDPGGSLSLTLELVEGRRTILEGLEVRGVRGRAARTVELVCGLEAGQPLLPRTLAVLERRLARSGYYDDWTISYADGLVVEVVPGPALIADGALGLREADGGGVDLFGELSVDWINIAGGARDLELLYRQRTADDADYRLAFRERYLSGGWADLGLEYDGLRRSRRRSDALALTYTRRLGVDLELSLGLRGSLDDSELGGESEYLGLRAALNWDRGRPPNNPAAGLRLGLLAEAGRRGYAEIQRTPLKLRARADFFWTPAEPHTLALLLEGGASRLDPGAVEDYFYLGGAAKPRGYRAEELPCDGYLQGSLEYRLRLGADGRLFAFGDAAYLSPRQTGRFISRAMAFERLEYSYGLGLNVDIGIGGLEVVYAVGAERELDEGVVQVRLVSGGF
jgi:outer membrane protein assembly factor BamA